MTIRGLADVCFRLKDWGEALTNYQKVLTALGEDETEERADVYYKLGCIKREQGQAKQAINNFEKALGVDGAHRADARSDGRRSTPSSTTGSRSSPTSGRSSTTCSTATSASRSSNEIGDIWSDHEKNPHKAIEALEEALDLQPQDHALLHKLLALYQATENWQKMVDTLQAIADLEKDADPQESKFLYTMAQLYRDKEDDQDRAVELFNEALDLNPQFLEAFERINKILTAQEGLEAARARLPQDAPPLSPAKRRTRTSSTTSGTTSASSTATACSDTNSAIEAFKMATRFKPDEAVERQILAELYEATDRLEAAIGEHAHASSRRTRCASTRTASLYKLYLQACTSTTARGACARRSRSCTRPTRRSSASSRTTARAG